MAGRLTGKRALVTAAGQGIGQATALMFAAEGAQVVATDIDAGKLQVLDGKGGLATRRLDVTDEAGVAAIAADLGAVDVLFNCAGYVHQGALLECEPQDWDVSFNLNVRAMYLMIRAFLPAMVAAGRGASIINMASVAGSIKGVASRCAYGASKAAVIGLTKSVAIDYVKHRIRCNAIAPGTVATPSLDERIAALGKPEEVRPNFVARQPLGRLGTAEEIAALAVYLAGDESAFTTGAVMVVDGGLSV